MRKLVLVTIMLYPVFQKHVGDLVAQDECQIVAGKHSADACKRLLPPD